MQSDELWISNKEKFQCLCKKTVKLLLDVYS